MFKPIRVLQLAKHFWPDTGGIETVTRNISEALLRHQIRADVLCTKVGDSYEPFEGDYRVIRCAADISFNNKRLSWRYVTEARRLERDYDCALVHLPNPLAVIAALGWRKPVILLWHADIPQPSIRCATSLLDRKLIRRAAAVIAPTPVHVRESYHAAVIKNRRIDVIPFPFDGVRAPASGGLSAFAKRLAAFRKDRALAISIGRLVPYKGFDVLINAARDFGPNLCAIVVGSGPLAKELAAQIDIAGVGDCIMLTGAVSEGELADALSQARMGCMPSVSAAEMYGLAQVECMASGLPMISTNIPRSGVPFVNRDNETGLLVEPNDPNALACAMRLLAEDEVLWQRLRSGALMAISKEHDLKEVGARYAQLIREIVDAD